MTGVVQDSGFGIKEIWSWILDLLLPSRNPSLSFLNCKKDDDNWVWWCAPGIPALGRLKQEDCKFKASLSYITRPCLKKKIIHSFRELESYKGNSRKIWALSKKKVGLYFLSKCLKA
jgi:hypothetical protein